MKPKKTILVTLTVAAIISYSCTYIQRSILKSSKLIALNTSIEGIHTVEITSIDEVLLQAGDSCFIEAIGCDNSQLEIQQIQKNLFIKKKKEIAKNHVTIVLHYKTMDELILTNIAAIKGNIEQAGENLLLSMSNISELAVTINCNQLTLDGSNLSEVQLKGNINHIISLISNASSLDFTKAITKKVDLNAENIADCQLYCSDSLHISLSNCPSLAVTGHPVSIKKYFDNVLSSSFN